MSIKNDRWIREQAAKGMIEPFEPGQVRSQEGQRIVSYGTSSYGYDVRCANEFKIFTNINSSVKILLWILWGMCVLFHLTRLLWHAL